MKEGNSSIKDVITASGHCRLSCQGTAASGPLHLLCLLACCAFASEQENHCEGLSPASAPLGVTMGKPLSFRGPLFLLRLIGITLNKISKDPCNSNSRAENFPPSQQKAAVVQIDFFCIIKAHFGKFGK